VASNEGGGESDGQNSKLSAYQRRGSISWETGASNGKHEEFNVCPGRIGCRLHERLKGERKRKKKRFARGITLPTQDHENWRKKGIQANKGKIKKKRATIKGAEKGGGVEQFSEKSRVLVK